FSGAYDAWQSGLHPDDRERGDIEIGQALRGEKEFDTEFRVVWPSGEVHHLKASAVVLRDRDGNPLRMIGVNYDISVRKATEEELAIKQRQLQTLNETLASQVAEEVRKNREKDILLLHQDKLAGIGQLAAGVAHEINNPMGFIMSNLVMLKKYNDVEQKYLVALEDALAGICLEERRKELEELRHGLDIPFILKDIPPLLSESLDGAERVKRIVLDLKDFARIDGDKLVETDLNQCVQSTANIVRNEIKYVADLELQLNEIPLVVCNPQQINQVIANLLINAGQAMENHGAITVTSRQEGEEVILSISDTGCGMTEEVRKRIFEPFFTTKDIGKGTGLGLSIAYGIIRKHGGEITLESELGRGTTFTIRLPIKRT
ncbi:MAG: sensor histidine kinase, partial [Syntrophales bacterium]